MTKRSSIGLFFLILFTFGIYGLIWRVKSKGEMCQLGADIPSAWFIIVPIANIWWLWKFAGGVELVTKNKLSQVVTFILLFVIPGIGDAIVQDTFNNLDVNVAVS